MRVFISHLERSRYHQQTKGENMISQKAVLTFGGNIIHVKRGQKMNKKTLLIFSLVLSVAIISI